MKYFPKLISIFLVSLLLFSCTNFFYTDHYDEPTYRFCMNELDGSDQVKLFKARYSYNFKYYISDSPVIAFLYDYSHIKIVNLATSDTISVYCENNGFALSSDGETAIIQEDNTFFSYDIASGEKTTLVTAYNLSISYPVFSPDGNSIIYCKFYETQGYDRKKILRYNFSDGVTDQLLEIDDYHNGGIEKPAFGPTGEFIYFVYDHELHRLDLSNGEYTTIISGYYDFRNYQVSDCGEYLIYSESYETYYCSLDGMDIARIRDGVNYTFLDEQQLLFASYGVFKCDIYSWEIEKIVEDARCVGYLPHLNKIFYILEDS